jgi:excisionase family DNA binding protein
LKSREAAQVLQVSARTLHSLAKSGALPVVRIGRSVRFDTRDLVAFIDAHKKGTP